MIKLVAPALLVPALVSALEVGNPAPPIKIAQWFNGEAASIRPGDVYVVEFWATWCGPCLRTIPHLARLQKSLAGKGLTVIGISNEPADTVKGFLAKHPEMTYRVAVDDDNQTSRVWMAGVPGIPHAFVVDKKGVVVWKGHPLNGMDRVVERVLAGTYGEGERKAAALNDKLQEQLQKNDLAGAEATCLEILALDPLQEQPREMLFRIYAFQKRPARDLYPKLGKAFAGNAEALAQLAVAIMTQETLSDRDPVLAVSYLREAKASAKERSVAVMRAQARIEHALGLLERAIATSEAALAAAGELDKEELQAELAYYRSALEAQKALAE